MKRRLAFLLALFCLVFSLSACNSGSSSGDQSGSAGQEQTAMTEDEYKSRVEELSTEVGSAISSMSSLSSTDEASFREGIEAVRTMVTSFREFAAISNPPESWKDAHSKITEGCTGLADSLEGLCDSAESMLDGKMTADEYNNAVVDYTTGLSEASALLTEGFGMMDS